MSVRTRPILPLAALLLAILALVPGAEAGTQPLTLDLAAPQPIAPATELVVRGVNTGAGTGTVVIRVDDRDAPDYAQRVNDERRVGPGPFTLRLRLGLARTPRGQALALEALRRAIIFSPDAGMRIAEAGLDAPPSLPDGTHGWFFGPAPAVPLLGFTPVAPGDPGLDAGADSVRRPSADPILAWGMRFTRFETQLPPGRWRLTLWTEDAGAWETLPTVLERRIRVNGADIVLERREHTAWVRARYLAGREREASLARSPWDDLGRHRGGRIDADVTLPDGRLVLELAGHPRAALHVAAMTASPADAPDRAADAVEAERARRFAELWPVEETSQGAQVLPSVPTLRLATRATAMAGGIVVLRGQAILPTRQPLRLDVPQPARGLWGQWRWSRERPEAMGLALVLRVWRADTADIPPPPDLVRPIAILLPIPPGSSPGTRHLPVTVTIGTTVIRHNVTIEVLRPTGSPTAAPPAAALTSTALATPTLSPAAATPAASSATAPPPAIRVGAFLDFAPHLHADPAAARAQAVCDMDTLAGLGLTAIAPALTTPSDGLAPYLDDLRAAAARFAPPFLAYPPARRMRDSLGTRDAARWMAEADQAARAQGLPAVAWTVADEPTEAGTLDDAMALVDAVRIANRETRLSGFLNDPADRRVVPALAAVAVNARFGLDRATIAALRRPDRAVWLYNMPRPRLGGGFQAWALGVDGLLQWHARMPTADPYDPTDGREGDVQFLWPTPDVCGPADLDDDLLDLVQGAEDARWLAWLDQAALAGHPAAIRLRARLLAAIPPPGAPARDFDADAWRARIIDLARNLKNP